MQHIQLGTSMPNRSGERSPSHHWSARVEDQGVKLHCQRARRSAQPLKARTGVHSCSLTSVDRGRMSAFKVFRILACTALLGAVVTTHAQTSEDLLQSVQESLLSWAASDFATHGARP